MSWEVLCKCSGKYIDIYFNLKITFLKFYIFQGTLNQICVIQIALYRGRTLRIRLYQISGC